MARTLLCGFEMGSLGEIPLLVGSGASISSSKSRSGTYSLRINTNNANDAAQFQSNAAGGTTRSVFLSLRFFINFATLPSDSGFSTICSIGSGSAYLQIGGSSSASPGLLRIVSGGSPATGTTALTAQLWHEIAVDVGYSSGNGARVYLNGSLEASSSAGAHSAYTTFYLGSYNTATVYDAYYDDVIADDSSFSSSGLPVFNSSMKLLLPTADPASLNSWTNGGGGTTSIFEGVNNIPPTGAAASTDGIKIKNAANGGNLDYVATMQTYAAAGIPVGSKINAVMAICNDGEEVGTNTKAGNLWISANPAQSAAPAGSTFDYGDDGGALGTFPSGWTTHVGLVTSNPSVTLSTAPTVTVRKTTSTTRVVDVDFLGLYVDYTLPVHLHAVSQPVAQNFHTIVPV